MLVADLLEADPGDVDRPRVEPPGRDREPDLGRPEAHGVGGPHGRPRHLAGGRDDARRNVHRDDRLPRAVDALDHAGDILARCVAEADPEQRVDDDVGLLEVAEPVDEGDVAAALTQDPGTHPPVAAVVSAGRKRPPPGRGSAR